MGVKELQTQLALGTIRWYSIREYDKFSYEGRTFPTNDLHNIIHELTSDALKYLLSFSQLKTSQYWDDLQGIVESPKFNHSHAYIILMDKKLTDNLTDYFKEVVLDTFREGCRRKKIRIKMRK